MAKSIKGITIELVGDSSKLVKALDDANKSVQAVTGNLKKVNSALKIDPSNVDALAKKQELLGRAIEATTKKLEAEKQASEEAKKALELGNITQNEYDAFDAQIVKTTSELNNLQKQANETGEALNGTSMQTAGASIQDVHDKTELLCKGLEVVENVGNGAGQVLAKGFDIAKASAQEAINAIEKVAEVSVQVVKTVGNLSYDISRQVVSAYGEYEQLVGGVEKIFGNSADAVVRNSQRAFQTATMDANTYLQTVTGFSASLMQGLSGDTARATELADIAIQDMSDNANTYGTDIQSIINAYQGFAKGTFNMLDNLRLGYGGTSSEMVRLINDSHILNEEISSLDNISFDQIIEAIHAIQVQTSIAGTTSNEAIRTVEGSINMLKASWQNLLIGLGTEGADVNQLSQNVANSLMAVANNVKPILRRMSASLPSILPMILNSVREDIPEAVQVAGEVLNAVGQAIVDGAPDVLQVVADNLPDSAIIVSQLLTNLASALRANAPQVVEAFRSVSPAIVELGADIIRILVQTISENGAEVGHALIDAIAPTLDQIFGEGTADKLRETFDKLIEVAPEILEKVGQPLIDIISNLIDYLPQIADIVIPLLTFASEHLPEIIGLLVTLQGAGTLAGIAGDVISISGAISSLTGTAGAIEGVGTAIGGIGSSALAVAGPIAILAGEVVALGYEAYLLGEEFQEAEELGISWQETLTGGVLQAIDDYTILGQVLGTDLAGAYYESQHACEEAVQTIDQQTMQAVTDIQLAIEQSGASATASVADDCAIIQSYLDNLEANGQIELHARVVTEYQTVMSTNLVNSVQGEMASRYAREGRRNTPEARAVTNYGREMASRYQQQGEEALRAVQETAQVAQQAITASSGGGGYSRGGGGGGGGSSRSSEDEEPKTTSKLTEIVENIYSTLQTVLKYLGIISEPTEYQKNVNQMIDGVLEALKTGYTDGNIETAMQELSKTMQSYGMEGTVDAQTLEQLRNLVNASTPTQTTEALSQVQGSVQAIQSATVDYTPHFLNIESVLGQILAIKESENSTVNVYVGNELLDTYISESLVRQSLVSGGI